MQKKKFNDGVSVGGKRTVSNG